MAKVTITGDLIQATGGFSKRTRWQMAKQKIDAQFYAKKNCVVLAKKTKRSQKSTEKQKEQREKWKLFDCIYKELTHTQRNALSEFYRELEKKRREGLTPYHYFMRRALKNYMKEELEQVFRLRLSRIQLNYSSSYVEIKTKIMSETFSEDDFIESFYERIARRT